MKTNSKGTSSQESTARKSAVRKPSTRKTVWQRTAGITKDSDKTRTINSARQSATGSAYYTEIRPYKITNVKHVGVSVEGQTRDKRQNSPKKIAVKARLIGNSNETSVEINGIETLALIDRGSQITTISEDLYNSMSPKPVLYSIEKLGLKIEGASGHILSYMGAIVCSLEVPFLHNQIIETAALVLPTTDYSLKVPVIVGTNVINRCRELCESTTETIPTQWKNAFIALQRSHIGVVKSSNNRTIQIQPNETITVSGLFRKRKV